MHDCVDDLTGAKKASFDKYNSDIEWTNDDFNNVKSQIQKFYREIAVNGVFPQQFDEGSVQEEVKKCFEIRKGDILEALIKESLLQSGCCLVDNFDWKLKWILGSSKLAGMREVLLQMDLHCAKKQENEDKVIRETVNFEMNLKAVDNLIEQLQSVRSK